MLIDGMYVLVSDKYIGPEKPGPWADLFYIFYIDVFQLGPLFIFYGLLWLFWVYSFAYRKHWSYVFGLVVSVATLLYLPVGTLFLSLFFSSCY